MSATSPSRVHIDLNAYAENLGVVRHMLPEGCAIMAVVKADAYGHGLVPIARRAVAEGVAMLGVATIDEAVALRDAGIDAPIVVMLQPAQGNLAAVVEYDLRLMVSDVGTVERLGEHARRANRVASVHCKIDSGMGRQGFQIDNAESELLFLTRISNIDIEGIATHFPVAERPNDSFTGGQIRAFRNLLRHLDKAGIPFEIAHASNSAAIINYPNGVFNMVRPGLMTYGVWPLGGRPRPSVLRPVLRWETELVLVKQLSAGASIGYGRTYTAQRPIRVAILPVGYADGYKYNLANKADVLVAGKRCPVRGNVSMDQIVVDVTSVDGAAPGDTAVLIGNDGEQRITVEELAAHAQTIPYDILTGIGSRVSRVYVE